MKIILGILWLVLFAVATYSWVVVLQDGLSWSKFSTGFAVEWKNIQAVFDGTPPSEAPTS